MNTTTTALDVHRRYVHRAWNLDKQKRTNHRWRNPNGHPKRQTTAAGNPGESRHDQLPDGPRQKWSPKTSGWFYEDVVPHGPGLRRCRSFLQCTPIIMLWATYRAFLAACTLHRGFSSYANISPRCTCMFDEMGGIMMPVMLPVWLCYEYFIPPFHSSRIIPFKMFNIFISFL